MSSACVIMKKRIIPHISLIFVLIFILAIETNGLCGEGTRTIIAPDGERIEIPSVPKRIACFYQPTYDKILMLSKPSRIALLPRAATPWAVKFYPELKSISINSSGGVPDVERLLKLKIDLVFYPRGHVNISKVSQAGIAAVCPYNDGFIPSTMEEYVAEFKKQILFFGEILGPEARARAEKYCRYLDGIAARIKAITSKIPEGEKPKVYYGKSSDLFSTQGNNTVMRWNTELAGGIYLPKKLQKYFAEVNMEQLAAWDPDIILLGMYGSMEAVKDNSGFKTLKASKSGKIHRIPAGMFYWDMTSCETALLPLFLGKKFHPALFKDWDIIQEMKKFYSEIYGVNVTSGDAKRMLSGLKPLL